MTSTSIERASTRDHADWLPPSELPPPSESPPPQPPPPHLPPPPQMPSELLPPSELPPSEPPPRPPSRWRSKPPQPVPLPSALQLLLIGLAAFGANLAIRVPAASLVTSLTVLAMVALMASERQLSTRADVLGVMLVAGLAGVLSVRSSPWVATTSLVAVAALIVLLAADGLTMAQRRPWLRSLKSCLHSGYQMFPQLRTWAVELMGDEPHRVVRRFRVGVVAAVVAVGLAALLASGDVVFASVLTVVEPGSGLSHLFLTAVMLVPMALFLLLTRWSEPEAAGDHRRTRTLSTEGRAAVWSVAVVLGAWCLVQLVVVAGGAESVLAAEGITPAEYARRGFFQLVAAAALSLAVLNGSHRLVRSGPEPDRTQRIPAALLGLSLAVLIATTFSRLWFYVDTFGLTMLRLSVVTFLCWLAVMTVLSVVRSFGLGDRSNWLPSAAVLTAGAVALAFAMINPEGLIAATNLDRATESEEVDLLYLTTRSDDAKPVVAAFDWTRLGGRPPEVTAWLCADSEPVGFGPLGWNRARQARFGEACGS